MADPKFDGLDAAVAAAVEAGDSEIARLDRAVGLALSGLDVLAEQDETDVDTDRLRQGFVDVVQAARARLSEHLDGQRDALSTYNIALFGRTGAGKSTLVSCLARLDGHLVSPQGKSDWTDQAQPVPWGSCRIHDLPGINGAGRTKSRAQLEEIARRTVEIADIVLLCFDNQSQQASEFAKISEWVLAYGKPVIAVLNCRNDRWRHTAEVSQLSARRNLTRAVHEHAGNVRDCLAGAGLHDVPIVAYQGRHALDVRSTEPYRGPDAVGRERRLALFGADYLLEASHLSVLEELITRTIATGGTELRLRAMRDGVRALLDEWAGTLGQLAAEAHSPVAAAERTVADVLDILGYPEDERRVLLQTATDRGTFDVLTELEDLRGAPFQSPPDGRLERHAQHVIANHIGRVRAESQRRAADAVRAAFTDRRTLSGSEFAAAAIDDQAVARAIREVEEKVGGFLGRELDLAWSEAQTEFRSLADDLTIRGRTGSGHRQAATVLRGAGLLTGSASAVLGVVLLTNPVGWVIAGAIGLGALSSALGWFGKRRQKKAEVARVQARAEALGTARGTIDEYFRELEDALLTGVVARAWTAAAHTVREPAKIACVLRKCIERAETASKALRAQAVGIAAAPAADQVLSAAMAAMLNERGAQSVPSMLLGDDWLDFSATESVVAHPDSHLLTAHRDDDTERLTAALTARWSTPSLPPLITWLEELAVSPDAALTAQARALADQLLASPLRLVLVGDYSTGKTSLLRRLLAEQACPIPAHLQVRGDPTTDKVRDLDWDGLILVDTPGFQSGNDEHDFAALGAVESAGLVVVVLNVNLIVGEDNRLRRILRGDDCSAGKQASALFVVCRSDEMGADPSLDPAEFLRYTTKKREELSRLLRRENLVDDALVHSVAGDPYGLVTDDPDGRYEDRYRVWDGIEPLVSALRTSHAKAPDARAGAARDAAVGALKRARSDLAAGVAEADRAAQASDEVLVALGNVVAAANDLAAGFSQQAAVAVRTAAERAKAAALGAQPHRLDAARDAAQTWSQDPELAADVVDLWTRAQRDIDRWRRRAASVLGRAAPEFAEVLPPDLKPGQNAPRLRKRSRATKQASRWTKQGSRVLGSIDHAKAYRVGKALNYKWRPWGAVRATSRTAKVGGVLGVVTVGLDVLDWIASARAEGDREDDRQALADFIESTVEAVTFGATHGSLDTPGPRAALDTACAEIRAVIREQQGVAERAQSDAWNGRASTSELDRLIEAADRLWPMPGRGEGL